MARMNLKWIEAPTGSTAGQLIEVGASGILVANTKTIPDTTSMSQQTYLSVVNGDSGSAISSENPKTYTISVAVQASFNTPRVNVLRLTEEQYNVVRTLCTFSNDDATSFGSNTRVVFDGAMKLKTSYTETVVRDSEIDSCFLYTSAIDLTNIASLVSITVA